MIKPSLKLFLMIMFLAIILFPLCISADSQRNYGQAEVGKIVEVYNDFTFGCDIKGWPDIIGMNVKVFIKGIEPPGIVLKDGKQNLFYQQQAKKFIKDVFSNAELIKLENIERAEVFAIKADVIIDEKNFARQLLDKGFARVKVADEQPEEKTVQSETKTTNPDPDQEPQKVTTQASWLASKTSKVFHGPECSFIKRITSANLVEFDSRDSALNTGRRPCKTCKP